MTDDIILTEHIAAIASGSGSIPPGTYSQADQLTFGNPGATIYADGVTLKKAPGYTAPNAIRVLADDVTLIGLRQDGNRSEGAKGHGIRFKAPGGRMIRCETRSNTDFGVLAVNGGEVDCVGCVSSDNVNVTPGVGTGFCAALTGRLRTYDCEAVGNGYFGFRFEDDAAEGCRLDGRSSRNQIGGAKIRSDYGEIGDFVADDDRRYGLYIRTANNWVGSSIAVRRIGYSDSATSGTGVEMFGCRGNQFASLISRQCLSYALAITADGEITSERNSFGVVLADGREAGDSDPGIHFSGKATRNSIGYARVMGHTLAVIFGEGSGGNDWNQIDTLLAEECPWGAVLFDGGSHNRIGRLVSRDCSTVDPRVSKAIVYANGTKAPANENVVERFVHQLIDAPEPNALFLQEGGATGNEVPV